MNTMPEFNKPSFELQLEALLRAQRAYNARAESYRSSRDLEKCADLSEVALVLGHVQCSLRRLQELEKEIREWGFTPSFGDPEQWKSTAKNSSEAANKNANTGASS